MSVETPYLTREEAAAYLRVSVKTLLRHVEPELPVLRVGARHLFTRGMLDQWLATQQGGLSDRSEEPSMSALPSRTVRGSSEVRARAILEKLRPERRTSTRERKCSASAKSRASTRSSNSTNT